MRHLAARPDCGKLLAARYLREKSIICNPWQCNYRTARFAECENDCVFMRWAVVQSIQLPHSKSTSAASARRSQQLELRRQSRLSEVRDMRSTNPPAATKAPRAPIGARSTRGCPRVAHLPIQHPVPHISAGSSLASHLQRRRCFSRIRLCHSGRAPGIRLPAA